MCEDLHQRVHSAVSATIPRNGRLSVELLLCAAISVFVLQQAVSWGCRWTFAFVFAQAIASLHAGIEVLLNPIPLSCSSSAM
ncbi:uncharacterized protein EI90DRAFT_1491818 [Cantharellus anzutake]|uniref:uncharacterized protein n=1 Tax=Cantharellus anzutake TaxID=1750568 RepID=UPI0019059B07|nr:uncharacterized protein EI90DRAFT_1491818 [Cantharellus anzutake]KAF8328936.1 hypothetical protein EI90DRAFT_1491818 [Cantharellus anzutake]